MIFVSHYDSPLGILYLAADEEALKVYTDRIVALAMGADLLYRTTYMNDALGLLGVLADSRLSAIAENGAEGEIGRAHV